MGGWGGQTRIASDLFFDPYSKITANNSEPWQHWRTRITSPGCGKEKKNLTVAQINDVNQYSSRKKKKKNWFINARLNAHRKHNVG